MAKNPLDHHLLMYQSCSTVYGTRQKKPFTGKAMFSVYGSVYHLDVSKRKKLDVTIVRLQPPKALKQILKELESKTTSESWQDYRKFVATKHPYLWFHPAWGDEIRKCIQSMKQEIEMNGVCDAKILQQTKRRGNRQEGVHVAGK